MSKLSQYGGSSSQNGEFQETLKKKYDYFKDMNKEQLNRQLMNEVARQKEMGNFDFATLSNMVESIKSALPEKDYQNIKRILESLK